MKATIWGLVTVTAVLSCVFLSRGMNVIGGALLGGLVVALGVIVYLFFALGGPGGIIK
jgi:hypothetical protein